MCTQRTDRGSMVLAPISLVMITSSAQVVVRKPVCTITAKHQRRYIKASVATLTSHKVVDEGVCNFHTSFVFSLQTEGSVAAQLGGSSEHLTK